MRRAALAGACLSALAAGGAAAQVVPSLGFGGSTLTFDGTSQFTIPTYAGIDIGTGAFTFAFRINATAIAADSGGNGVTANNGVLAKQDAENGYKITFDSAGSVNAQLFGEFPTSVSGGAFQANNSTHFAFVVSTGSSTIDLYQDGSLQPVASSSFSPDDLGTLADLVIGAKADGTAKLSGQITNLLFFKSALGANDIATLAQGTVPGGVATIDVQTLLGGNASISIDSGTTLKVGQLNNSTTGASSTFSGAMTGAGNFQKVGTGSYTFNGTYNGTGKFEVAGGTVVLGAADRIGSSADVSTAQGGTLNLDGNSQTFGSLSGDGGTVALGSAALTVGGKNTSTQYGGTLTGAGSLRKMGTGTLTLTGANTYSGGTVVSGGRLKVGTLALPGNVENNAVLEFEQQMDGTFSGAITGTGQLQKTGPGTLTLTGANTFTGGTMVSAGRLKANTQALAGNVQNNAVLEFDQPMDGTFAGSISGTGQLQKTGTGTLTLTGANNFTGGTMVSGGTLAGSTSSLPGTIVNNAAIRFQQAADGTHAGTISGTGSLTKTGSGSLMLAGSYTYSGGTLVSEGTLQGNAGTLQGAIVNNAIVAFNQAGDGTFAGFMSGSGRLFKTGAGTLTLAGQNTYTGGTQVTGGTVKGDTTTLSGDFALAGGTRLLISQQAAGTFRGRLSGAGRLVKEGAGTVTLTGANSHTGGTQVTGGVLKGDAMSLAGDIVNDGAVEFAQATDATQSGSISGSGSLTKSGAGTLILTGNNTFTGGTTVSQGTLVGNAASIPGSIANNAAMVFDQPSNATFTGSVTGSGALTKRGAGILELDTDVTAGSATVEAGELRIGAGRTLTAPTVTLTGGTLSGTGTIAGAFINQGGRLSPGTSPGTLRINGDFRQTAGTTQLEVQGSQPGQFDQIVATGRIDITGGTIRIEFQNGFVPSAGDNFRFFVADGGVTVDPGAVTVDVDGLGSGMLNAFDFTSGQFTTVATTGAGELQRRTVEQTGDDTQRRSSATVTTVINNRIRNLLTGGGPLARPGIRGFQQPGGGIRVPASTPRPATGGGPPGIPGGTGAPGGQAPGGQAPGGQAPAGSPPGGQTPGGQSPDGATGQETGTSGGDEPEASPGGISLAGVGVWTDADYTSITDTTPDQKFAAQIITTLGGADIVIGDRLVVGAGLGYEVATLDFNSFGGGRDSDAYTGIAYAAYAIDATFTAAVQGSVGQGRYDIQEVRGTVESVGEFETLRLGAGAQLLALLPADRWELLGTVGYSYGMEQYEAYVTSLGDVVRPATSRVGLVSVGGEAGYAFEDGVTPYLGINFSYDHLAYNTDDATGTGSDGTALEVTAGLRLFLSDRLSGGLAFRQQFDRNYEESYAGAMNVRYQF